MKTWHDKPKGKEDRVTNYYCIVLIIVQIIVSRLLREKRTKKK